MQGPYDGPCGHGGLSEGRYPDHQSILEHSSGLIVAGREGEDTIVGCRG